MVQEKLQSTKPSQDEKFTNQVLFFTAVLENKTDTVRELIRKDSTLLDATAEWKMAIKRQYWVGSTALDLAVGYGHSEMTDLLLGMGATVNTTNQSKMSPLHTASIMDRPQALQTLLSAGAKIDAKSANGQTALHVAAIRNRGEVVSLLLQNNAAVDAKDQHGRTPADWASLLGNQTIVDELIASGAKESHLRGPIIPASTIPVLLETGIKIIDFCAPLKRGGVNGVFTPFSGVGFMVIIGQIMRSVQKIHNGSVLLCGLNTDHPHEEFWDVHLRESDADSELNYFFEQTTDDPKQPLALLEKALAAMQELVQDEREVLLVLDSKLAMSAEVLKTIRTHLANQTSATVLVYGHHTVGVLPPALDELDSVLTFSGGRAAARLYPAIDPARSTSTLFDEELKDTPHAKAANKVRRLMTRYNELRHGYDAGGPETLWYIDDDPKLQETLTRARRLDRFFTQPFSSLEPWTGTLGEYVSLADTVRGCQEILAGKHDDADEDEFMYKGTI